MLCLRRRGIRTSLESGIRSSDFDFFRPTENSPFSPRTEIEILFCRRLHAIGLVADYQHCSSCTRPIATIRGPTESSAAVLSIWGGKRPEQGRRLGRNRVRSQRVANQTSRRRRPSRYGQLRLFSNSREVLLPSLTPKLGSHGFYEPIRS